MNEELKQMEESAGYTPRPRWHRVLAWILTGVMVVGIIGYYYWIAFS